ncbi:MAG: hypothetical protein RBS30_10420 [Sphaerochaetaceae bacterium]|jgi:hypothetical protein|nr:hypothetical protein [Sphaerochaetaceae bacterium]
MKTRWISISGLMVIAFLITGCLPLYVVGTTPGEVMASRETVKATVSETPPVDEIESSVEPTAEIQTAVEETTTYHLGDTGPAGGYVFYDKDSYSDGWRYMELAPEDAEGDWMPWGGGGVSITGTSTEVGTGYENTKIIISEFKNQDSNTVNPNPASFCDQLVYNGYNDWFLPSRDELILIYQHLIVAKRGGFPEDTYAMKSYWSSSADTSDGNTTAFAYYLIGSNGNISSANRQFPGALPRAVRRF